MADSYPYMVSNNKIEPILKKIRGAARPTKFTNELLKQLGFVSSNDRAVLALLKKLGFLTEEGTPTEAYGRLKDESDWKYVLGEKITELYKDIFNIDTNIHKASDTEIKGAMARVTGKDEASVGRYLATFKTIAALANFDSSPKAKAKVLEPEVSKELPEPLPSGSSIEFSHNIQIQLPATTDVSVYNAIFKSLKDNLLG